MKFQHLWLEHLLRERHKSVNVLHSLVGLLPQLHVDGGVQLDQPRVEVHLLRVRVVQVDRVRVRVHLQFYKISVIKTNMSFDCLCIQNRLIALPSDSVTGCLAEI